MPTTLRPAIPLLLLVVAALAQAAEAGLPDPLVANDGTPVATAEAWQHRRGELLELFRREVYGRAPVGRPADLAFTVTTTPGMLDGAAVRKQIRLDWSGPGGKGGFEVVLFVPVKREKPAACFLLICNRAKEDIDPTRTVKVPFWPAEAIIARGYAAAAFFVGDVAADNKQSFTTGVHTVFGPTAEPRPDDAWGTIAAWAWGASRVIDYLVTDPDLDAKRIAVIGHSRGGKTALWCGAQDERVALTISNDSGCTGAAVARGKQGETIAKINKGFPYWFCGNYKHWNDREAELPVDQHELIALCAPRLVCIASASDDAWADPAAEFHGGVAATPVWTLLGKPGLVAAAMPGPEQPQQEGSIGYHIRTGKHDLAEYDWKCYLDFADKHLR